MADETRSNKVCMLTVAIAAVVFLLYSAVMTAYSQSTSLDYPTAVTSSQIAGKIRARDIGDSRLTSHYYIFETGTGDVLLNIESLNLNGDIDIYTAGSLKPLLKASVYANSYASVMQRDVYLRLPSRLILRIEGRTPNDDPGEYKITFSGVFKSIAASSVPKNPGDPKVAGSSADGAVARVTSTGAIIEEIKLPPPPVKPPLKEPVKKEEAKKAAPKDSKDPKDTGAKNTPPRESKDKPKTTPPAEKPKKPPVVVVTPLPEPVKKTEAKKTEVKKAEPKKEEPKKAEVKKTEDTAAKKAEKPKTEPKPKDSPAAAKKSSSPSAKRPVEPTPEELTNVFLVIKLRDEANVRYAINDVEKVNVTDGILTVTLKNGGLFRRSLVDVIEMKIGQ